jgi:hypothetical protein
LALVVALFPLFSCLDFFNIDPGELLLEKAEIKFYKTQQEAQLYLSLFGAQSALLEVWSKEEQVCESCMVAYQGRAGYIGLHYVHPTTNQNIEFWQPAEKTTIVGPIWVGVLVIVMDVPWLYQIWVWPQQVEDGSLLEVSKELIDSDQDKHVELGLIIQKMVEISTVYTERMRSVEGTSPFDVSEAKLQYLQPYQSAVNEAQQQNLCTPLFDVPKVQTVVPSLKEGTGTVDLLVCSDSQSVLFAAPEHIKWLGEPDIYHIINVRNIGPSTVEGRFFPFDNNFLAPPLKIPPGHIGQLAIPTEFNSLIENEYQYHLLFNPDDRKEESTYIWLH